MTFAGRPLTPRPPIAGGMTLQQIADLTALPLAEVLALQSGA